jgi:hypothetical protein
MKKTTLLILALCAGFLPQAQAVTARVLHAYTSRAANMHGGGGNLQSKITSYMLSCDQIHVNSQTWVDWDISRWYLTGIADNRPISGIVNDLKSHSGLHAAARESSSNLMCLTAQTTDSGGQGSLPGQYSVVDADNVLFTYYSHELGHNYNALHEHGLCFNNPCTGEALHTIMQVSYCGGRAISWYSNPAINRYCRYLGDSTHNNAKRINDIRYTRSNTYF